MELLDTGSEKAAHLVPSWGHNAARQRQADARLDPPERSQRAGLRHAELDHSDPAARLDHACKLAHRRGRIIDITQQVGEGESVECTVLERQLFGMALHELNSVREGGVSTEACT